MNSLTLLDWCSLVVGLILSLGPGYALASLYFDHRKPDSTEVLGLSVGLSIGFWSVVLAWLHGFGIALTPRAVSVLATIGWLAGLLHRRPWTRTPDALRERPWSHIALWAILIATATAGLYSLRGATVGPGSDSYHHSLIARMITERGMLPDNYEPFAPLTTFTYHFGFHGLVAVISWLTGMQAVVLAPIVGQFLNAAAALSAAFFTLQATRRPLAATLSAGFTGLVSVFPAFFINWGRFTQLAGLVMLPIFLGLVWRWLQTDHRWSAVPFIGLLAAGIGLVHYRVTLMAAIAVIAFLGVALLDQRAGPETWREVLGRLIVTTLIAGILVAPWVWHVVGAIDTGYANEVGRPERAYFQLNRLGADVLTYPTNEAFIGLALVALLLGWWRRERPILALSIWATAALLVSAPQLGGIFLDTVSVLVSLYFPASVAIGWLGDAVVSWLSDRWQPLRWVAGVAILILTVQGMLSITRIVEPNAVYVGQDDMSAMAWIRSNTPRSAYFMVNTFSWDFSPRYIIGSDGGYWLPLLANRRTVTLPMTYPLERSNTPDLADRLAALHALGGHLTSSEAIALLRREGVTHVYVGQRGGPIVVSDLLKSPAFDLQHRSGAAYVFRLH